MNKKILLLLAMIPLLQGMISVPEDEPLSPKTQRIKIQTELERELLKGEDASAKRVKQLLNSGAIADFTSHAIGSQPSLELAIEECDYNVFEALISKVPNINKRNFNSGISIINQAVAHHVLHRTDDSLKKVRICLKYGTQFEKETPMFHFQRKPTLLEYAQKAGLDLITERDKINQQKTPKPKRSWRPD